MISLLELRAKAERKYNDFLKSKITGSLFFSLEIRADKGSVRDNIQKREADLKELIQNSKDLAGRGYKLFFEAVKTRANGNQSALSKILFESEEDFLFFIKKEKETRLLEKALKTIASYEPKIASVDFLNDWALHNIPSLTKDYTEENDFWENICLCVNWLNTNPNSGLYIREIPLSVHTKFIEQNSPIIKSLSQKAGEQSDFITTFGLKGKNDFVRFKSLSKNIHLELSTSYLSECYIPLQDFCQLDESFLEKIKNVIIIENEMVYLTMPEFPDSICVWGQGYKVNILSQVEWFKSKSLFYFGDLDEHGFDILSTYRSHFPDVKSFCMSEKVLQDYSHFRVEVKTRMEGHLAGLRVPENLTEDEKVVFMALRKSKKNRLEQERISVEYIREVCNSLN